MKKLTRADIRGPVLYAGFRDDLRRRIIDLKKRRRVSVGPSVTLVFENRATVIFQIEEMCRAENLTTPEAIDAEIAVYNAILPDAGQVAATLFVEITDEAQVKQTLDELVGLQHHVWLEVGEERLPALFDAEQFAADKLAAVQYLRFALTPTAQATLRQPGGRALLRIDHPNYHYETALSEATRSELVHDLGD